MNSIALTGRGLGEGYPCFVIAEAGVNHDGEPTLAHQLVDLAADAGADAVKFQIFDPVALVSLGAATAPYQARNAGESSQRALLDALTLPREEWKELARHARERDLVFLSTAFDLASLDVVLALDVPALKVPSGELTNLPFLRALAGQGLPLLVSTGMGSLDEVAAAVDAVEAAPGIALFHCVSAYPAPPAEANLRAIATMLARFGVPTGWSDHTVGALTALGAVALGAAMLEKHITTDPGRSGPDHAASASPEAFEAYVEQVRAPVSYTHLTLPTKRIV